MGYLNRIHTAVRTGHPRTPFSLWAPSYENIILHTQTHTQTPLWGKYPELLLDIYLSCLRFKMRLEHGCSKYWTNFLNSAGGSHAYTSVRLHRINPQQEGRARYRRVSGSDFSALWAICFSVSSVQCTTLFDPVTKKAGLHTESRVSPHPSPPPLGQSPGLFQQPPATFSHQAFLAFLSPQTISIKDFLAALIRLSPSLSFLSFLHL